MNIIRLYKIILFIILSCIAYQSKANQTIDTVGTYIELKLYDGEEDTVYVDHERYFGSFTLSDCTTENYGTTFIGTQGCWQRIHDNFSPRFWEIGGQSPDNSIGIIQKEVDAINSAAIAAYNIGGDTILIDSMYSIDRTIFLLKNNTYLGTSDSAGFIREDPPVTILTDTAKINDNHIKVEDNTGFRTYHKINIANGIPYDSIAGFVSYNASISLALGGDSTIFLSGRKIQKEMLPGDSVSLFFPMMGTLFNDLDSIHIKNLIFDGNAEKYNLNYDWRTASTIYIPTTNQSIIEDCKFYNIPNENIFLCGATFKNCSGSDLNGSILHFSCNSYDHPTEVLYNNFSNTNIIGDDIMAHSEAGFTFSAKVQNLRLAYNTVTDIGEYGVGRFQNDDKLNEITDNLLNSASGTIQIIAFYSQLDSNIIYNNKNLNFADLSMDNCWENTPSLSESSPCQGNSSSEQPLEIGDTITLTIDSILLKKSNENFVKYIIPIYDDEFFRLDSMEMNTPILSQYHEWIFDYTSSSELGLIFNNGHRNGIFGEGNWGYEGCSQNGGCTDIKLYFIVENLPDSTGTADTINCPFQGIEIIYDGEAGNWNEPFYCQNEPIYFDENLLGYPILATLPIELLYIRGEALEKKNKITWASESEENTAFHVIEYSDGINDWKEIGRLDAAGFSTTLIEYEFWDYHPKTMSYYRLKTIDTDESIHLSNTISIKRKSDNFKQLNISPIPVENEIHINFQLNTDSNINITLSNMTGQIMTTKQYEGTNGINRISLDLSTLIAGVYFLQIDNGEEQIQQLIVK